MDIGRLVVRRGGLRPLDRARAIWPGDDMVRRRSPSHLVTLPDPLPNGWVAHDGSARPVAADAMPGLWMRSGLRIQIGTKRADHWDGWHGRQTRSCWTWENDAFDILAWKVED